MKAKLTKKVYTVVWPKGSKEDMNEVTDFDPIGVEPLERFQYKDKGKKWWGSALAVFDNKAEAEAWRDEFEGPNAKKKGYSFEVREASLSIL